jgi:hypothetical protein
VAKRVRRIDPYAAIGIVPEDVLQRAHGSRAILGAAERADSPRALVPVGVLQTFAHVNPAGFARPQRREQEKDPN